MSATITGTLGSDTPEQLLTCLLMLRADAPTIVYGAPENWPRWAALLPHVLAATAHVVDDTSQPTLTKTVYDSSTPGACSWLLDRAGTYLQAQGHYRDAATLMRRALAIGLWTGLHLAVAVYGLGLTLWLVLG